MKGASILMPNDEADKSVLMFFFKYLNISVLLLILGKVFMIKAGERIKSQENNILNYLIIILVIVL